MKPFDLTRDGRLTVIVWSLAFDIVPIVAAVTGLALLVRYGWPNGHEAQQLAIIGDALFAVLFIWWTAELAKLIVLGVRAFKGSLSAQSGLNLDVTADTGGEAPIATVTTTTAVTGNGA